MKYSILVIEDEEKLRELLSDILTYSGHEAETVSDGHQGVEMFKHGRFDLVFTDLRMPGMSGLQVAEEIKKIERNAPVVLITGSNEQLEPYELEKSGIDVVINKPFRLDEVSRLLQGLSTHSHKKYILEKEI